MSETMTLSQLEIVAAALEKNNIRTYCVENKEQVVPLLSTLLQEGQTVAVGGSQTLQESGVMDLLRSGKYTFIDRDEPGLMSEERLERMHQGLSAKTFLCSSNAVTQKGELYNVDGKGNRVSALCFGPEKVILVVGCNKIVEDLPAAVKRVKTIAAPLNTRRLNCQTPCAKTGHCLFPDGTMAQGCTSPQRICVSGVISAFQREKDRIHVILVGESLGF